MAKLDIKAFGVSFGIVWGLGIFMLGLLAALLGQATGMVDILSSVYLGYEATITGSLIGGAWGFVDAAVGGVILAWLYNKLAK